MKGRLHTRYAPVRRSLLPKKYTPRLACVKPAASVHPEPGSNSSSYNFITYLTKVTQGNFILTLYSHSCVLICIRTAVNSICLGTCLTYCRLSLKAGAKVQLLFNLASLKTSFLKENHKTLFNKLLNFAILILKNLIPFGSAKIATF